MVKKEYKEAPCILCGSNRSLVYYQRSANDCILKCLQCGLLFVHPRDTNETLKEYYRDIQPDYLLKYKSRTLKRGRKILDVVGRFKKKGCLLDVGCGYGFFMDVARRDGWKALGVELSPAASEFARTHFALDVFTGDVAEADLAEDSFDLITVQHVLEHLPEPLKALNALRGKLRNDGVLVIVVPNAVSLMARCAKMNWLCLAEKSHLFHYSKATLKKLLEKSGFRTLVADTFQYDTCGLLWALKVLMLGQKGSRENVKLGKEENIPGYLEEKVGLCKRVICKMAYPFSWAAGKAGLGAEIMVLAKKEL